MHRTLKITALLSALGALTGTVTGAFVMAVIVAFKGPGLMTVSEVLAAGSGAGFITGLVVTPILAWSALRSIPLWRAAVEPALAGSLIYVTTAALQVPLGPSVAASLAFASAAALRLRLAARTRPEPAPVPAPQNAIGDFPRKTDEDNAT